MHIPMLKIALKMLIGNKASCLGVIFGIFLATLLISQQSAIFLGLVSRSYRFVTDNPAPNVWIMDPATESDIKVRSVPYGYLDVVRSIPNIEWAEPINVMDIPLLTPSGLFNVCQLFGIDDESLVGAPQRMVEGDIKDLRRQGGVIIDVYSANELLAKPGANGKKIPLTIGDTFEINNRRAVIIGLCKITPGFYPQPVVFTSLNSFRYFTLREKSEVQFIVAKTKPGVNIDEVLRKINAYPVLNGLTTEQFSWRIAKSFLQTGILINFGLSVALGIIIGFSIAGQIFYIMTLQNLVYYALIKSLGGDERLIVRMLLLQTGVVSLIGFLIGTGVTMLWGFAVQDTSLAFLFPWQLLVFSGLIVMIICLFTTGLSVQKVLKTDPKLLMND